MYLSIFTHLLPYYFFNSIVIPDLTLYTFNSIEILNLVAKSLCKYNKFIIFNLYSIIIYENLKEKIGLICTNSLKLYIIKLKHRNNLK